MAHKLSLTALSLRWRLSVLTGAAPSHLGTWSVTLSLRKVAYAYFCLVYIYSPVRSRLKRELLRKGLPDLCSEYLQFPFFVTRSLSLNSKFCEDRAQAFGSCFFEALLHPHYVPGPVLRGWRGRG